jgi:hypothetical protein
VVPCKFVGQWSWLETELAALTTDYVVLASSTTFYTYGIASESWEEYPTAHRRLADLLAAPAFRAQHRPIIISGDVHSNECYDEGGVIEIVSSGGARRGIVFGAERRNWCLMTFSAAGLRVELHGLRNRDRDDFTIPSATWTLP